MTAPDPSTRPLPRLEAAADLVPPGSRVADIGSGHGLLAWLLLASGRAAHCVAGERTRETLERVRPIPPHLPFADRLERRWGDGLAVLDPCDRIDVAVLLGMGARTIERILDAPAAARLAIPRFVFQPQTDEAGLRAGLSRRGLAIEDERLVRDRGRVYLLLACVAAADAALPEHPELSPDELVEVGPVLARSGDPLVREVWRRERRRRERIAGRATGGDRARARESLDRAVRILAVLERHAERLV